MGRIRFRAVLGAALSVTVLFSSGALPARAQHKEIEDVIKKHKGHLPLVTLTVHPTPAKSPPDKTGPNKAPARPVDLTHTPFMQYAKKVHKGKVRQAPAIILGSKKVTGSQIVSFDDPSVGPTPPNGFGKTFFWDRKDESIVLVVFVNPADFLGVSISNLKAGDTMQVTTVAGAAAFSKDTGHPFLSGLVGLLAAGAKAVLDATGDSAFDPVVAAAEQFAKDQFKGTGSAQQFRDAFGVDESGGFALEEGGVIVVPPQGQGPYYSADPDHRDHWASQPPKGSGRRGLPKFLQSTPPNPTRDPFFFLSHRELNLFPCTQDGEAYILAWDQPGAFGDNTGFYKIFVHISQQTTGSGSGGTIFSKDPKKVPPKSPKDK
jgi:hypothetical protein